MKYFDAEEKKLIQAVEKKQLKFSTVGLDVYKKAAKESMQKSERINIRISRKDLKDVKRMASLEGIPYQTFVSSLIHKAANKRA